MANLNATGGAQARGYNPTDHDYGTAPLGKFGKKSVKLDDGTVKVHKPSTSRSFFKKLGDRIVKTFGGSDGKIRSANLGQKEAARLLGNILGRAATMPRDASPAKVLRDVEKLSKQLDRIERNVPGFDRHAFLDDQIKLRARSMELEQSVPLASALQRTQLPPKQNDSLAGDLDSVGLPQAFIDDTGDRADAAHDKLAATLLKLQQLTYERADAHIAGQHFGTTSAQRAILIRHGVRDPISYVNKAPISDAMLDACLTAKLSVLATRQIAWSANPAAALALVDGTPRIPIGDAVIMANLGRTAQDVLDLQGEGFSTKEAITLATKDMTAQDLRDLRQAGLDQRQVSDLAHVGCKADRLSQYAAENWTPDRAALLHGVDLPPSLARAGTITSLPTQGTTVTQAKGGAMNETFKVSLTGPTGTAETHYFSKSSPRPPACQCYNAWQPVTGKLGEPRLAQRTLASAALDAKLGFNMIPPTKLVMVDLPDGNGGTMPAVGTLMAKAAGSAGGDLPLQPGAFAPANPGVVSSFNTAYNGDVAAYNEYLKTVQLVCRLNGGVLETAPAQPTPFVNLDAPGLRQGLTKLHYMDMLAGQVDRSPANYFLQQNPDGSVSVTGIDNDLSWGTAIRSGSDVRAMLDSTRFGDDDTTIRLRPLPPIADREIYDTFMNLTDQDLDGTVGKFLDPAELAAAKSRLADIKDHLRTLEAAGKIVNDWQGQRATDIFNNECTSGNSYLKRDAAFYVPPAGPGVVAPAPTTTALPSLPPTPSRSEDQ